MCVCVSIYIPLSLNLSFFLSTYLPIYLSKKYVCTILYLYLYRQSETDLDCHNSCPPSPFRKYSNQIYRMPYASPKDWEAEAQQPRDVDAGNM